MNKHLWKSLIPLLTFAFILSACNMPSQEGDSAGGVSFIVPIDVAMFSQDGVVRARLWSADQLEITERTANCAVSYNQQTQTEEVHCPEGIEYQEVTPEEFIFPIQEIGVSIKVSSDVIRVGEKYRLLISGPSNDNCNTTSASVVDIARSSDVNLDDIAWETTVMACP